MQLPLNLSTGDTLKVAAPIPVTRRGSKGDGGGGRREESGRLIVMWP